jgi:hypothetical protein
VHRARREIGSSERKLLLEAARRDFAPRPDA